MSTTTVSGGSSICEGQEDSVHQIGQIGFSLYFLLFLISFWRTVNLWKKSASAITVSHKKCFHVFLNLFCFLELFYYGSLIKNSCYTKGGYICHLLALFFDLCSFSMVIIMWSRVLSLVQDRNKLSIYIIGIDGFLFLYTVVISCLVLASPDFDSFLVGYKQPYLSLYLIHSCILLLFATWLVVYGFKIQLFITRHPRWEPLRRTRRLAIIGRIMAVLLVCTICFLMRVVLLFDFFFSQEIHNNNNEGASTAETDDSSSIIQKDTNMSITTWYWLCNWLPTIIPSILLLIMMRKTSSISKKPKLQNIYNLNQSKIASKDTSNGRQNEGNFGFFQNLYSRYFSRQHYDQMGIASNDNDHLSLNSPYDDGYSTDHSIDNSMTNDHILYNNNRLSLEEESIEFDVSTRKARQQSDLEYESPMLSSSTNTPNNTNNHGEKKTGWGFPINQGSLYLPPNIVNTLKFTNQKNRRNNENDKELGTRRARLSLDDGDGIEEGYDTRDRSRLGQDMERQNENINGQNHEDRNIVEYTYHTDDFGQDSKYNNPEDDVDYFDDDDEDDDIEGI